MERKTKRCVSRILALALAFALCLSMLGAAPGSSASSSGGTWVPVTSAAQFTTGQYYMVTDTSYAPGKLDGAWVTAVEAANAATDAVWTLTVTGDSVTLTDANDVSIAPKGGNNNGIKQGDYDWAWSFENGKFKFSGQGDDTVFLASNKTSQNKFRGYKTSTVNGSPNSYPSEFTLYKLDGGSGEVTVAVPQADPQAGAVVSGTQVTLSCATSGAVIYYTLDGNEPSASSTQYTAPFEITDEVGNTVTLKAIAILGDAQSAVQTIEYTIKAEAEMPIADGDKVVIYNPAYNMALSSERSNSGSYYNKGVPVTIDGETVTGYGDTEIWTVNDNGDGTWSFSNSGQNIGMDDQYTSMPQGGVNDDWELIAAANDCWYVKNTVRNAYIEWYESNNNWSAYYNIDSGTEDLFELKFYKVTGDTPEPEPTSATLAENIAEGNIVVIYHPNSGNVMGTAVHEYNGDDELNGVSATVAENAMAVPSGAALLKVYQQDGHYVFKNENGYLYLDGNNVNFSAELGEYNYFGLESTSGGWYIKSVNAEVGGNAQYLEYFHGYFTCFGLQGGGDAYTFQFYKAGTFDPNTDPLPDEGETAGAPIKDGDKVGIYMPGNGLVITADADGNRLYGASATLAEGTLTTESTTAEFTVGGNNEDGFTFTSADGKYLTTGSTGGDLTMEDAQNDYSLWILEQNGDAGWYIKNKAAAYNGNAQYIEYYSGFTTYRFNESDSEIFTFQFYPITSGQSGEEVTGLEVLASPVSGAVVRKGDTIELIAAEGATIYYTTDGSEPTSGSTVYTEPLTVGGAQVPEPTSGQPLVVKALAVMTGEDGTEQAGSVYTFTYKAPDTLDGYKLYFGQLHSHTNISDGAGSVTDAFEHAAGVENLDFLAVTDHSNSFDNEDDSRVDLGTDLMDVSNEWKQGHDAADEITAESNGTFVGIYGFEMTWSDGFGHINTFNTPGFESRSNSEFGNKSGRTEGYQNYYDKLKEVTQSLSQFNHPGTTFGDFQDFAFYDPVIDQRITLIEVGNGEGAIGSSGYFPSYEYYTRALDKGWHVAPTNNQDNHKGNWGDSNTARSVVLAYDLTEEAIYDAIANYRVYATEDNDLSILYSLNGNAMGSILPDQDSISISAKISDPTDSADMKVEVIVNGGLVAATKTLSGGNGTVEFSLSDDYSYYYLRVTQSDGNIAVTAPVWTGESVNAGISKTECDTALVVKDEEVNISSELYNNSGSDMTVNSVVYSIDNNNIYTATSIEPIASGDTYTVTFPYTFTSAGKTTVNVTMTATIGETEYTFTSVLQLTVTDASIVTRVLVDGTHYNDYVTGYYSGNMGNFTELAAGMNAQVTIKQFGESITAEDLEDVSLLIISAPLRYSRDGLTASEENLFSNEFVQMVGEYVRGGGTAIVCGLADYQDGSGDFTTYVQINKLLKEIGSTIRVNDDELIDQDENGGQQYRLYFDDFNYESTDAAVQAALSGLDGSGKVYSSYSGCSINVGNGTPIVFGHDTTYSINSKNPSQGHNKPVHSAGDAYNENDAVVQKGDVVSLATEAVGQGRVYVGGTVWMSDFEVANSEGNDYGDASYANKTIITNILSGLLTEQEVSNIEDVRANSTVGTVFTVEGTITAGNVEPNAFYDTIYIQDATGGINIYPVATTDGTFRVGQKVRVTGSWDQYQGDTELRCISIELIDSSINPVEPAELGISDASDYEENGGLLSKVSGTVKSVVKEGDAISSVILTDGTNDFRLLFNNYIGYSNSASPDITTFVKEGAEISAVGVIYMDPQGACLRVRDLSEVALVSAEEPDDPDEPIWPVYPGDPVRPGKPDEDDDDMPELTEPFIDVNENDWFYDAVVYVYNEGMMSGIEADVFSPDGSMTRAMFWTVLARIDGADTSGGLEWYSAAQKWAISEGVSDGTEPNALITREQLATMLWRYAGEPEGNSTLDGFTDSGSVSYWAYDALVWAVENGIVTGMGDGILAPQGTATRAQAATMFMRYMSVVK